MHASDMHSVKHRGGTSAWSQDHCQKGLEGPRIEGKQERKIWYPLVPVITADSVDMNSFEVHFTDISLVQ